MLATTLEADKFLGRVLTGKIKSGKIKTGEAIKALNIKGQELTDSALAKFLLTEVFLVKVLEEANAGDIVALAGIGKATVADTLCALEVNKS